MVKAPARLSRRRSETRQRLLDAALEVFAEEGFGRSTVEQVCERAGFTRGAFYSNFGSLDELFLAMWNQKSRALVDALGEMLRSNLPERVSSLPEVVEYALSAVPVDDAWYRVTAEFTAHALRTPGLGKVMAAREKGIQQTLLPVLDGLLAQVGREITDRAALGQALVAVHDGTMVQCLLEPDDEDVRRRRTALFLLVVEHHTRQIA